MGSALIDVLAEDLLAWMDSSKDDEPRSVLLWLDPEREFKRLVPHLIPVFAGRQAQLLSHGGKEAEAGQLDLKLALLRLGYGERAIVYLPGFERDAASPKPDGRRPVLWSVYEYRFKGCVWGRGDPVDVGKMPEPQTLYLWLKSRGLKVADEKTRRALEKGGAGTLLARYAEHQRNTDPSSWPSPLRLEDVEAALSGDSRDALRGLLAAPHNEVKAWGEERATVLGQIEREFGIDLGDDWLTPNDLADGAAVSLALTEAWDAFGQPNDFPFAARLAKDAEQRRRQTQLLRTDVLPHADLGPRFRERMRRLEPNYQLGGWAENRVGYPAGLPLLAQTRWRAFLDRLKAATAEGWKAGRTFLREQQVAIRAAVQSPYLEFDDTHWRIVEELFDLAERSAAATAEIERLKEPREFVNAYSERWWEIDRLHLRIRAGAGAHHLDAVWRLADGIYFDWASRAADRFWDLVAQERAWPPKGTTGVGEARKSIWQHSDTRTGIVITDACRWDLGQQLSSALGDEEATLEALLSTLPTITRFGMAALLPLPGDRLSVDVLPHDIELRCGEFKHLQTREGRKALLRKVLADDDGRPRVDFLDLEELLHGAKVPAAPIVVVFDNGIDEQGHKRTEHLPTLAETLVKDLKHAVERLHEAGIPTVHVVTDHGFILAPADLVEALGGPEVVTGQHFVKDHRWVALKPEAPVAGLLTFPAPLAPDFVLGFPKGLRTLIKGEQFLHGGISLQECVIPHLVSRRVLKRSRIGLELSVTTDKLSGGTVPVVLRPRVEGGQAGLGGFESLQVRLWVETSDGRKVAGPIDQELRVDVQELRPPLYLKESSKPEDKLQQGETLHLRAENAETEENLGTLELTLLVDWE